MASNFDTREEMLHRRAQMAEADSDRWQQRYRDLLEAFDGLAGRFTLAIKARETYALELRNIHGSAVSSSSVADPWLPIETAPKNRTIVMLYGCEYGRRIWGRGYYFKGVPGDGEGWIASSFYTEPEDDMRGCFTPSHWKPMPNPPSASSASAEADSQKKNTTIR